MNNNKIGLFIASARKNQNLTQQDLGDKLFVTGKAVSKWERGLSLPDIALLEKLAKELNVNVSDILAGEKNSQNNADIEKEIEKIRCEVKESNKKKKRKLITIGIILFTIIIYILFRNIYLGYNIKKVNYEHTNKTINIGIPRTSFMIKNNDRSYSFKSLRSSNIVENEVKRYLKTLKYSTCNDTIYYYNEKDNFSIINYSIKNHILYSTISYEIVDNDYCLTQKLAEYNKKLGGLNRYHTFGDTKISFYEEWDSKFRVYLIDGGSNPNQLYEFKATLKVEQLKRKDKLSADTIVLEESSGDLEIKDNKLYYYRKEIIQKSNDIEIPNVSTFLIEDGRLVLIDNYLSNYGQNIILK